MNLDQLYARMKTIKERNEKILDAKQLLTSGESKPENKKLEEKTIPSLENKTDQD